MYRLTLNTHLKCDVFPEFLENEHIDGSILSQHMPDSNSNTTPRKTSFRIVSELDLKKGNIKKKQLQTSNSKGTPPVQKKLFWKKRKQTNPRGNCHYLNRYRIILIQIDMKMGFQTFYLILSNLSFYTNI